MSPIRYRVMGAREVLTIFRVVIDCVYSARITYRWWRETVGDDDLGSKLGARWSRLCGVNHPGVLTIRFGVAEAEVPSSAAIRIA